MSGKGIYIPIRGDWKELASDLKAAKTIAVSSANEISDALGNALTPKQAKDSLSKLVTQLNTLRTAANVTGKDLSGIGIELGDLQKVTGLTAKEFATLQTKMLNSQAARQAESALKKVAYAADLSEKEIRDLGKQFKLTDASIDKVTGTSKTASSSFISLGNAVKTALAYLSIQQLTAFAKSAFDVSINIDMWQRSMVAITGSAQGMAAEMEFLRQTAELTGQNFYGLTDSYRQLTAATTAAGIELGDNRKIFSSVAEAGAVLGLSSERVTYALEAMAQMASKEVVSMEELRRQLGDHIPGAMGIAAKAMGVSTQEMFKMVEGGEVLAKDLLPKLADELHKMYGEAAQTAALESGAAAVNRMSEEWADLKTNLVNIDAAVAGIHAVTTALEGLNDLIDSFQATNQTDIFFGIDPVKSGVTANIELLERSLTDLQGAIDLNTQKINRLNEANGGVASNEDQERIKALVLQNVKWAAEIERVKIQLGLVKDLGLDTYQKLQAASGETAAAEAELVAALEHGSTYYDERGEKAKEAADAACEANKKELSCEEKLALKKQELRDKNLQESLKASTALAKQAEEAAQALIEEEEKKNEALREKAVELKNAYREIYKDLAASSAGYASESLTAQKNALDEQVKAYEKMGVEEDTLRQWRLQQEKELYKEWALENGTFVDGVIVGLQDICDGLDTIAKTSSDTVALVKDGWEDTGEQLAESFMDGGLGTVFEEIGDIWTDTLTDMLAQWVQYLMNMALAWGASEIASFLTGTEMSFSSGIFSGGGSSPVNSITSNAATAASLGSTAYTAYTGESAIAAIAGAYGFGELSTVTPYAAGAGQILGSTAPIAVEIASVSSGALPTGMGFAYGSSIGATAATTTTGSALASVSALGVGGMLAPFVGLPLLDAFGLLGSDTQRYDDLPGAVVKTDAGVFADFQEGVSNSIAMLEEAAATQENFAATLEMTTSRVEYLGNTLGDAVAAAALGIDGTVESADNFIDQFAGLDVSMSDSASMLWLAAEAADGTSGATLALYEQFYALTDQTASLTDRATAANSATMGMIAAINELSETDINISVSVNDEIINSVQSYASEPLDPASEAGGNGQTSGIASWLSQAMITAYHADGGIMTGTTEFYPGHIGGEAGPEVIAPLHAGPNTLEVMHNDIKSQRDDSLAANVAIISQLQTLNKTITRWEKLGMPEARV